MKRIEFVLEDENIEPHLYEKYISELPERERKRNEELAKVAESKPPAYDETLAKIDARIAEIENDSSKSRERKDAEIQVVQVERQEHEATLTSWREGQAETISNEWQIPSYRNSHSEFRDGTKTHYDIRVWDESIAPQRIVAVQIHNDHGCSSIESTGGVWTARAGELRIELGPKVIGHETRGSFEHATTVLIYEKFSFPKGARIVVWMDGD